MKKVIVSVLCFVMTMTLLFCVTTTAAAEIADTGEQISDVPQVHIVTEDGKGLQLQKADGYIDATVTVTDTDGTEIGGEAQVKIRGNSTSGPAKKPYTVKFSKKLDILGMGKAKKWALLANAFDPTQLRNYIGVDMANELGLDYTSRQQFVEVWMDGSFRGCYHLIEPIQEGKERVDIDIESNEGMKDFLIERERTRVEEDATYFTTHGVRFVCDEPEEPNDAQLQYIQRTMDDIIAVLKNGTREKIEEKIDVPSFAKYYILNEYVKDVDFDYSSVFFYYKDGKLYAGPAWDYDLAMGNEDTMGAPNYVVANRTDGVYCDKMHLYQWLCSRDWFFDVVRSVWLEHSAYLTKIGLEGGLIDRVYQKNAATIARNFSQAGWKPTTHYVLFNRKPDATYAANLDYLKDWCTARGVWLNTYFTEDITDYVLGDSNLSGEVEIMDATAIQRVLVSLHTLAYDEHAADVDGDGYVSVLDATDIQRHIALLSATQNIGEQLYRK